MSLERDVTLKDLQINELKTELNRLKEILMQQEHMEKSTTTSLNFPEEPAQRIISHPLEPDTDININTYLNIDESESDSDKSHDIHSFNSKISGASSNPSEIINDWDDDANSTLKNWYYMFEEMSHSYQYILDRNYKMASQLSMISVVSSSFLSIFAGFKLWLHNDAIFQTTSDITMMIANFAVAGVTTMAKRYIDDNRNEKIRIYIEDVDRFMNLVYAQYCLKPIFRVNAKDFFKNNNETYTKLMMSAPNLSISEMETAKTYYKKYKKTYHC